MIAPVRIEALGGDDENYRAGSCGFGLIAGQRGFCFGPADGARHAVPPRGSWPQRPNGGTDHDDQFRSECITPLTEAEAPAGGRRCVGVRGRGVHGLTRMGGAGAREKIVFTSNCASNVCPVAEQAVKAEIYMMNPDGSNATRLTNNNFGDAFAALSPDGRGKIVFDSNRIAIPDPAGGLVDSDLFLINHDGTADGVRSCPRP